MNNKYSKENVENYLLDIINNHKEDIYNGKINILDIVLYTQLGVLYKFFLRDGFEKKIGTRNYETFTNYEYNLRNNIIKTELLKIREILIELDLYNTFDFLETFIFFRDKKANNLYFEDIVPELYDDLKAYIIDKYNGYTNESLIVRDLDVDINDYIYPLLGDKLTKKLFQEIGLDKYGKKVNNFLIDRINNFLDKSIDKKVYKGEY